MLAFSFSKDINPSMFNHKQASTVLCSVVRHAGSGRVQNKCTERREKQLSVFPYFLSDLTLPKCFTTEQGTVEASLCLS